MRFFSYLLVAALAFGLAFYISNRSDASSETYDFSGVSNTDVQIQESTAYTTYYDQLTDYQKAIYDTLLSSISKAEKKITFANVNLVDFKNSLFPVCVAIQYDHPEYFWYAGGYTYSGTRESFKETGTVDLEHYYYQYVSSLFNAEKKYDQLMDEVKRVAELARSHSDDDYERIIFVHDYLIENAYYDHDALEEYCGSSHNPSCEYIFTAYGCLVEGKTVCSGYAKAFQLILRELGYDCSYVTGDAGEAHGWNCVYLDGEGYYVDITWDDLDIEPETPVYNHTFITSEELSRTHTVDMEFDAPVCNATDYNYFVKRNYYLDTYDFNSAAAILSWQKDNNAAHIKFGSLEELGKAYEELAAEGKVSDIEGMSEFSQYYYNEDHYTISFFK